MADFKQEAVALVTEQGYSFAEAAQNLGVNAGLLRRWKIEMGQTGLVAFPGQGRRTPDQSGYLSDGLVGRKISRNFFTLSQS